VGKLTLVVERHAEALVVRVEDAAVTGVVDRHDIIAETV
jgi:hypothetical protein